MGILNDDQPRVECGCNMMLAMQSINWREIIDLMRTRGIDFRPGLSATELSAIEARYRFGFPEDLRAFLSFALPHGRDFPDWRGNEAALCTRLNWPLDGLLFDLRQNALWRSAWGSKPADLTAAETRVRELVTAAPRLIPLFGHRYLPAAPAHAGSAVLSVHQSDIIRYAPNLAHWLNAEFALGFSLPAAVKNTQRLPFWDDLIEG